MYIPISQAEREECIRAEVCPGCGGTLDAERRNPRHPAYGTCTHCHPTRPDGEPLHDNGAAGQLLIDDF